MLLTIRPALRADAVAVGSTLRRDDANEVEAAAQMSPLDGTVASFDASHECYAVRLEAHGKIDATPALLYGVTGDGAVWLLATDAIKRAPLSILREAPFWLDRWNAEYGDLWNFVDTRNSLHVRWLQVMGFHLGDTHSIHGHPFIHAVRPCVQQHQ